MTPYCVTQTGTITIEAKEGDVVFQLTIEETEYTEAIINYFIQMAKEEHKLMLQALLDRVTLTPDIVH